MDKRDDQELFIPFAGSFRNPVNQPPPSIPPPPYESYDAISTPTAPYPTDFNTNETVLNVSDSQQNDKDVQNKGFIKIGILNKRPEPLISTCLFGTNWYILTLEWRKSLCRD